MSRLSENAMTVLASTTVADVQTDGAGIEHVLYTVPPGKRCIVDSVIVRDASADLAGMNDCDFGGGATCDTPAWLDNETGIGAAVGAVNTMMILRSDAAGIVIIDGDDATVANRSFGILLESGSTGAASCTFDVIGYLIDS